MKLITEMNDEVDLLIESSDTGKKNYFISGVFMQAEQKNRNGRVYPMNVLDPGVQQYNENFISKKRAFLNSIIQKVLLLKLKLWIPQWEKL